jgi:pyruvate formate lyase activating enzyme
MRWGGLIPFSLSDFPGCVSAIAFTKGCNFRCPYCHNPGLMDNREEATERPESGESRHCGEPRHCDDEWTTETILSFLRKRSRQLDGLVISGGEPTCQRNLVSFAADVKKLGYRIKLDTNGSAPGVLSTLISRSLVDYVAMDIKAPWRIYPQVGGTGIDTDAVRRSVHLLARGDVPFEFRVTAVSPYLSAQDLLRIGMEMGPLGPLVLQKFSAPAHLSMSGMATTPGLHEVANYLGQRFNSVYVR